MQFTFNGTLPELKDKIQRYRETLSRDIIIRQNQPDILEIGFLRFGRRSGRYFVANITEDANTIILDGKIRNQDIPFPKNTQTTFRRVGNALLGVIIVYIFFGLILCPLWWAFRLPHFWISLLLPILPILFFLLPSPYALRKKGRSYDYEDEDFCLFMDTVCGKGHPVPTTTQELYQMLAETQGLHSLPKFENDTLIWELYDKVTVEASIIKNSTIIELLGNNFFRTAYTHWHPNPEEMYGELRELGKEGHILVLRKTLLGTETYYYGDPNGYTLPKKKKWHWGRLIYLEQKRSDRKLQ